MLRNNLLFLLALAAMSTVFISCDDDDSDDGPKQNIVELAQGDAELTTLVAALTDSRFGTTFTDLLSGTGPFTVFAPTNSAFQALLDSNDDWNSLADIPQATLDAVLRHHVLGAEVKAADLFNGYATTQSLGPDNNQISLQIETSPVTFNGNANPTQTDIDATNGVIHKIDAVMLPPNVVTLASNNDNFSTLVAALTDARFGTTFTDVLSGTGPFTVFAPTNAAFQALLDSNDDWNSLADIPQATLENVLRYHVTSAGNVQSSALTDDQSITMLTGTVTINLADPSNPRVETTSDQEDVRIILTDVQGTNGVIHAVEEVLLP